MIHNSNRTTVMSTTSNPQAPASFTFRPESYWEDPDPLAAILRNIKGSNRRKMITDYWNAGKIGELDPAHLEDSTEPGLRQFLESLHPTFMGGEYLPDLLPTEVEIARIELQSTTADVISIRARRQPGDELIHYRIVDEYETTFSITPETSEHPLSLGELVQLIDTVDGGEYGGLALCYNEQNLSEWTNAESLRHFTTVESAFYPALFDHYDGIHEEWMMKNLDLDDDEDEQDEED